MVTMLPMLHDAIIPAIMLLFQDGKISNCGFLNLNFEFRAAALLKLQEWNIIVLVKTPIKLIRLTKSVNIDYWLNKTLNTLT